MPVPPRRAVKKTNPAKAAPAAPAAVKTPAAKTPGKLRSAGGDVKYTHPKQQYLDKEPTPVHQRFVEWVKAETGYDVDLKTVQLAFVLRIPFQKSELNQEDLGQRRAAAEERKSTPVVKAGPVKRTGPIGRKKVAEPVEEAEEVEAAPEVEEVDEAPVKVAPRRATKVAPGRTAAKTAPPARGRKVATPKAKAAAAEDEAAF